MQKNGPSECKTRFPVEYTCRAQQYGAGARIQRRTDEPRGLNVSFEEFKGTGNSEITTSPASRRIEWDLSGFDLS